MREFKHKVNKTTYFLYDSTENYVKAKVDVIFNYSMPSLSEGDNMFVQIHKEGGSIIYQDCLNTLTMESAEKKETLNEMPAGSVFLTRKGMLNCWKILHLVFLDKRGNTEENCRSLSFQTLFYAFLLVQKTYQAAESITSIALRPFTSVYIRDINKKDHEKFVGTILNNSSELTEVHIYCHNPKEFNIVKNTLLNRTTSWVDLILKKLGF